VITNLRQTPRFVYERVYCARGDIENRIKELHDGLQIGRTSCGRFWANQLRVLLTAAAYVLMQELRLRAARTACARAQVTTLRERLLKLGVHVVGSVCRIVLHLPTSTPFLAAWRHIALEPRDHGATYLPHGQLRRAMASGVSGDNPFANFVWVDHEHAGGLEEGLDERRLAGPVRPGDDEKELLLGADAPAQPPAASLRNPPSATARTDRPCGNEASIHEATERARAIRAYAFGQP